MQPSQSASYLVGVDLGTSSCKSVVVDNKGHVLGYGMADYPAQDMHARWEEQDPETLIVSMVKSVREAVDSAEAPLKECIGLSIGGAFHSLIVLDRNDRPLTGLITWADNRASAQANALRDTYDTHELYQKTGCPVHASYPLSKIVWLREERPQIFEKAAWFISGKEYVTLRLTGHRVVDYAIASAAGLLDIHSASWSEQALELARIEPGQLFTLTHPKEILYGLDTELAAAMGLASTTPMILGSGDAVNSSLGAGAVHKGQATCMVGSSGALRVISSLPILDLEERSWCYAITPRRWLVGGVINNGGIVLQWLQHALSLGISKNPPSFEDLLDWAEQIAPGAQGLLCLPFLIGERSPYWNANARAVLFGLNMKHDQRHLARAILEGVCFRLRSVLDVLDETIGKSQEVRASGGFTRSDLWLRMVASILDREILVPDWGETSSLGAAFWIMLGKDLVHTLEDLGELVEVTTSYSPIRQETHIYEQMYGIYNQVYNSLHKAFDEISALQAEMHEKALV